MRTTRTARTRWRRTAAALALAALGGCALAGDEGPPPGRVGDPRTAPLAQRELADGFYGVLREGNQWEAVGPAAEGEQVVVFLAAFRPGLAAGEPGFLAVPSVPDVPLRVAAPPVPVESEGGAFAFRVRLVPDCAGLLESFTRDRVGRRVALLVGGEVVCAVRVRAPLTGGFFTVICADEATYDMARARLAARVEG